jgi:hypothetical protein
LTVVCQDLLFKKWGMGVAGMPMGNWIQLVLQSTRSFPQGVAALSHA